MAKCVEPEYIVGFVYSVVYKNAQEVTLIAEGELLSFDDSKIEIKESKGSVPIERSWITKTSRK